jgi:hypothetical protein
MSKPLVDTKSDSREMKKVFRLALDEIEVVLRREKAISEVTRVAANTLSNYSRVKSTEIHDKALELMMARRDMKAIDVGEK